MGLLWVMALRDLIGLFSRHTRNKSSFKVVLQFLFSQNMLSVTCDFVINEIYKNINIFALLLDYLVEVMSLSCHIQSQTKK